MVQPDCCALVNSTRYVLHPNFIFESCIFEFCRFSEHIKALCHSLLLITLPLSGFDEATIPNNSYISDFVVRDLRSG